MKITAMQYAQSLYEAAEGKSHSEIDAAVGNFIKILAKNNQIKNIGIIIDKFKKIWNKKEGIAEAKITSREKLNENLINDIDKYVSKKYQAKKTEIENIIDEKIKGGVIIQVGDEVIDKSIARQLKELNNILAA